MECLVSDEEDEMRMGVMGDMHDSLCRVSAAAVSAATLRGRVPMFNLDLNGIYH
jgi:hypothetical protein